MHQGGMRATPARQANGGHRKLRRRREPVRLEDQLASLKGELKQDIPLQVRQSRQHRKLAKQTRRLNWIRQQQHDCNKQLDELTRQRDNLQEQVGQAKGAVAETNKNLTELGRLLKASLLRWRLRLRRQGQKRWPLRRLQLQLRHQGQR